MATKGNDETAPCGASRTRLAAMTQGSITFPWSRRGGPGREQQCSGSTEWRRGTGRWIDGQVG